MSCRTSDFEKAIEHVLAWEGGLVNHPSDPGGLTNRGITIGTWRRYAPLYNWDATIEGLQNLTKEQAKIIYKERYWDAIDGDEHSSYSVALLYFDGYVNSGRNVVYLMQRAVQPVRKIKIDGWHGRKTMNAILACDQMRLFERLHDARHDYYVNLNKPMFIKGWLRRLNSITWQG